MATVFLHVLAAGRASVRGAFAAQPVKVTPEVGVEQPVDKRVEAHGAECDQHAAGVDQREVAVLEYLREGVGAGRQNKTNRKC